ncbi:TatD family hydrolase [Mucilaginibacter sp. NFX135]|uniref:TatD family hydrolase n=1 Tax=Mucilaginibacter sp. NFX135 TaxID=3402687 RepID=UPI003AFA23B4
MDEFLHDTHAHIDLMADPDSTVLEIENRKIYTIAVTNLPVLYRQLNSKVSSRFIRPALGFHPELLAKFAKDIPQMWDSLEQAKYIGEVGIDLKVAKDSQALQVNFFEELVQRCHQLGGKILTIHSRGAAQHVVNIIGHDFNGKFILHWYSGGLETLDQAVTNGAYISVNYAMTCSASGRRIIQFVPKTRLLLESDAPFVNVKGKCYDTLSVALIVEQIASIKRLSVQEISIQLHENFKRLII